MKGLSLHLLHRVKNGWAVFGRRERSETGAGEQLVVTPDCFGSCLSPSQFSLVGIGICLGPITNGLRNCPTAGAGPFCLPNRILQPICGRGKLWTSF
jgi:hypothetical protein